MSTIPEAIDDILTDWYTSRRVEQRDDKQAREEHDTLMAWINGLIRDTDTSTIAYMLGYEHGKDAARQQKLPRPNWDDAPDSAIIWTCDPLNLDSVTWWNRVPVLERPYLYAVRPGIDILDMVAQPTITDWALSRQQSEAQPVPDGYIQTTEMSADDAATVTRGYAKLPEAQP